MKLHILVNLTNKSLQRRFASTSTVHNDAMQPCRAMWCLLRQAPSQVLQTETTQTWFREDLHILLILCNKCRYCMIDR